MHLLFTAERFEPVIPKSLIATCMEAYRTFGPQPTATNHFFARGREIAREGSDSFLQSLESSLGFRTDHQRVFWRFLQLTR